MSRLAMERKINQTSERLTRLDSALPQKSISVVANFEFNSCDFVDPFFVRKTKDDPRSHTNQHEAKHSCLELDPTFEAPHCSTSNHKTNLRIESAIRQYDSNLPALAC